ncbi:MAG: electron transfer flavoprotein subunit alpha [Candidatus Liberibacter europaeus]|uniref:Electron transfer flavoprotein subunit alpha n=1 Tax=Candidatus Liberibacter europaeus TaxID=744859 RepID=A0A2T4VXP8_9HYPH|nr:electron transfer flavoprotein subunit alpha [Candidatus Liberibacter europaeus]PTL86541.1 MAG: electron transfer flavoprotein subunit alpha [Candidatus Liberibacter europaeus]
MAYCNMPILLLADYNQNNLSEHTSRIVTAAKQIGHDIHILVMGDDIEDIAQQASKIDGITKVIVAQNKIFSHQLSEPVSDFIVSIAKDYGTIMADANATGKDILPRVAAILDSMQVSEIIEIISPNIFKRPTHSGNIIQTVETTDKCRIITVRSVAFPLSLQREIPAHVEKLSSKHIEKNIPTRFIKEEKTAEGQIDLASARIVIAGGKSLGSKENFQSIIIPLAKKLGAAVGATRDAVYAGFAPNDWQIGQTGIVVSPELYIAAGISGAIQHISGMKESKIIVAINKDENAPIFKISDYFIVGDIFEILPEIERYL